MGTKGSKPLSTLEKRQKKVVKEEPKKKAAKEEPKMEVKTISIDESLTSKAREDLENVGFITVFSLAQKFNIKYSIGKKIIKELVNRNAAEIVAKNRRVIVAVSKR
ncbi:MAG: hypothetical protein N3D82_02615 [Ignisphaera sp.]|nr:hypothetical protein [Ignisphaera sp.]MCX8167911.1 hypothetical protein [Ignisphaera sp.]MDW8085726.1 hypothetical protein [Ignisphaera sp.]